MKKIACIFAVSLFLVFSACSEKTGDGYSHEQQEIQTSAPVQNTESVPKDTIENQNNTENDKEQAHTEESIKRLTTRYEQGCYTNEGFYYLTEDTLELSDGSYGRNLMYMDFASGQEIYLCNNAGCSHDTPDCTSVFSAKEFLDKDSIVLFIHENLLYILAKDIDEDGSVQMSVVGDMPALVTESESIPVVLYSINFDGTDRKKVYSFEPQVMVEDIIFGDKNGIYAVSKKIKQEKDGNSVYTTSASRKLVYLDFASQKEREVCTLEFGDNIDWQPADCYGRTIVLMGQDFGNGLSKKEQLNMSDDDYMNMYENSDDVFALLDIDTGNMREVKRINNKEEHSVFSDGQILYFTYQNDGSINSFDMASGEEKMLGTCEHNDIYTVFDNMICMRSWDIVNDATFYYFDINTGKVNHSAVVNKCNGWPLEFAAELDEKVLVIYDYEAVKDEDDAYDITGYKYALISKKDLFAGKDNFSPVKMVGKGF